MTPERWKRTEALYHEARATPPADRTAFLARACPDDVALRRDVESLLDELESGDEFLAGPALAAAGPPSSFLPGSMTGVTLGGYNLRELVGAGGMGEVYRARDAKLERDVAIKILPAAFTGDPQRLARFQREARMLAALNHPNICAIYGLEEAAGIHFLILELVEGATLASQLAQVAEVHARPRGLALRDALGLARQLAEALEVAHDKGIVHRDLKPANVKITPVGVAKVLDFGLAKAVTGDGSSSDLTRAPDGAPGGPPQGPVIGTAAYMSPEQARGSPTSARTSGHSVVCSTRC
jgi:serine/threonine protein kinase